MDEPAAIDALVVCCGRRVWRAGGNTDRAPRWAVDMTDDPDDSAVALLRLEQAGAPLLDHMHILFLEPIGFTAKRRNAMAWSWYRSVGGGQLGPLRFESEAVMALRAVGRDSGVALCVEGDECAAVAVREGVLLGHTARFSPLGGGSKRERSADALEALFRPRGWKVVVPWEARVLLLHCAHR